MQIFIWILIVLLLWIIYTYNLVIKAKNYVKNSYSGIDVQLKRRNDLIPNLISVVKGYVKHESKLLNTIVKERNLLISASNKNDIKSISKNEFKLDNSLKSLFAVAENYPDLKANKNFLKLQEQLQETEDQIAASRRIYNENVTYYNNKIQYFPNNYVAKIFKFKKEILFVDK